MIIVYVSEKYAEDYRQQGWIVSRLLGCHGARPFWMKTHIAVLA